MQIPFLPTILEHAAAVIGVTPSDAARDAGILAKAHIAAWRRYGHEAITVGIDVYNGEAEALGCEVRYYSDNSIPGIVRRPGAGMDVNRYYPLLEQAIRGAENRGRLPLLLEGAKQVKAEVDHSVPVGLGISGPFSICCELMGFEGFVGSCMDDPDAADAVLGLVSGFLVDWCSRISAEGIGITLFESWAAPPLLSPGLYRRFAAPWERLVISAVRQAGGRAPVLVIGGDTTAMLPDILSTGTALVVCDYSAAMGPFLNASCQSGLRLRGNIDPKLVSAGPVQAIIAKAAERIGEARGYGGFVLGTGVLPYNTPAEHILALSEWLQSADRF